MDELQGAVTGIHVLGERYLLIKQQIADCVARQGANREALAALKAGAAQQERRVWLRRPGGVTLRLPAEQATRLLQQDQRQLEARLEGLFAEQRRVLAELEERGVGPDYITATA